MTSLTTEELTAAEKGANPVDDEALVGSLSVKQLRVTAGLTQAQLADMAALHVRTIRGLETGRIRRPHRQSLELIGRALGLDVTAHLRLLSAWGLSDTRSVTAADTLLSSTDSTIMDRVIGGSLSPCLPVAVTETVTVGVNRRVTNRRTEEVLVALRDGVNMRHVFYDPDDELIDLKHLHLVRMENCRVANEFVDPVRRTKVFEVALGQTLSENESHVLRYTADFGAATVATALPAPLPRSDQAIGGFFRSPSSYLLEVRFLGDVPRRCAQIFQATPTGVPRNIASLQPNSANSVHIALTNPRAGGHGIVWAW